MKVYQVWIPRFGAMIWVATVDAPHAKEAIELAASWMTDKEMEGAFASVLESGPRIPEDKYRPIAEKAQLCLL